MNNIVNFKFGTLANYQALQAKDNDTLYFADGQILKAIKYIAKSSRKLLLYLLLRLRVLYMCFLIFLQNYTQE